MRVLPGFDENAKIKLLQHMKDQAEIIICIYAGDITTSKTRHDFGITYDLEVMRLIDTFRRYDLAINSVVVTRYEDAPSVNMFINKLERRGIKTYKHRFTKGYPTDVDTIVSDEGYGANPYIEVTKPLVVVTGPGGGSRQTGNQPVSAVSRFQAGNQGKIRQVRDFPNLESLSEAPFEYRLRSRNGRFKRCEYDRLLPSGSLRRNGSKLQQGFGSVSCCETNYRENYRRGIRV